jgi:beta-glucanase (GH16 family)
MKITMQMLCDLGVCDGAQSFIGAWFAANKITEIDYTVALQQLIAHQQQGQDWIDANTADTAHSDYNGWIAWMRDLPTRPAAIMYFGDHIEEDMFRTTDGHLHDTLAAAQDHRRRSFAALRQDHAAARIINGVTISAAGAETWQVVDPGHDDLTGFDAFIWHDSTTGLNHRTDSVAQAMAFDAAQANVLDQIDAAEAAAQIERRITDESGVFHVWVPASSADPTQTEG